MSVDTLLDRALERARTEQSAIADKRSAYESLDRRVQSIATRSPTPRQHTADPATSGVTSMSTAAAATADPDPDPDGLGEVRDAFAETVMTTISTGETGQSIHETMAAELGPEIAVMTTADANGQFTPRTKRALRSHITERTQRLAVMARTLEKERESLDAAAPTLTTAIDWIAETNPTPLSTLDFDALRSRHETLDAHHTRCQDVATARQRVLDTTTTHGGAVGLSHRSLLEYLYADLPVTHPVLTTTARLDDVCAACQRSLRAHLVRRV
jgi:hypothetical protein